ncbi:MAG TPA: hypothetical protein VD788_04095, partial [Candidatus Polarisedimenticolaceae bacterium]|nr:hypothetical protein [Candidatus Polarisedimenticolaceae bacterium]
MADGRSDFYIGYEPRGPRRLARRMRLVIALLFALALALAALLVGAQRSFDGGVFEFGVDRQLVGTLVEQPYPLLRVPGDDGAPARTHLLVGHGKHGAGPLVAGLDGRVVRVSGSPIHHGRHRMIEIHRVETIDAVGGAMPSERAALGTMTLAGEIVDSKCHLGVMKPGRGKTHRACAVRCISGGSPPLLRVEDRTGRVELFLLVDEAGASVNRRVLSM